MADITGTSGSESLTGTADADTVNGLAGDDTLSGLGGGDLLIGGGGADVLIGGTGADVLKGNSGADALSGGADNDTLIGGDAADTLSGGDGDDRLSDSHGNNVWSGGAGADRFDVFLSGHDNVITDFDVAQDELQLHRVRHLRNTDDLIANATEVGSDLVIQTEDGSLTLQGLSIADISSINAGFNNSTPVTEILTAPSTAVFLVGGQSNVDLWFKHGSVIKAFEERFEALTGFDDVVLVDVSGGGSAMLSNSAEFRALSQGLTPGTPAYDEIADNYWINSTDNSPGSALTAATDVIAELAGEGVSFQGMIWAQGEGDVSYLTDTPGDAGAYQGAMAEVFGTIRSSAGLTDIFVQQLGDQSAVSLSKDPGAELVRQAQFNIAQSEASTVLATSIADLALDDDVHLTRTSYEQAARRMADVVSGVEQPLALSQARVQGDLVTLTINGAGSNQLIVPTDPVAFRVLVDGEAVAITGITQVGTTPVVQLSVDTFVQGQVEIAYGQNAQVSGQPAGVFVTDDDANASALLAFQVSGTVASGLGLQFDVPASGPVSTADIAVPPDFAGTGGDDLADGDTLPNFLQGLDGNDTLNGKAGDDFLQGDDGADSLRGLQGDDSLFGGLGNDNLDGDGDDDVLSGGDGDDTLNGDRGFDLLDGWAGDDNIIAGSGLDTILGGDGADFLRAGAGDDRVRGDDGNDKIIGQGGSDLIFGGSGDDTLRGEGQDDTLIGGAGDDIIHTGTGSDHVYIDLSDTARTVVVDIDTTNDVVYFENTSITSLSEIQSLAAVHGTGVQFVVGSGATVKFVNLDLTTLGDLNAQFSTDILSDDFSF